MALPNLLVIGAMKAGTFSLHNYLGSHPSIEMSLRRKELNYFVAEKNWRRGQGWYQSQFRGDTPLRGESSTRYSMRHRYAGVPERVGELIPDARLIYLVRDPIRRLQSHYVHNVDDNKEAREFEAVLAAPDRDRYLRTGLYHEQLQSWLENFPAQAIRVVCFEDLVADPTAVMSSLFDWLGVYAGFRDSGWLQALNDSQDKRRETPSGRLLRKLVGRRRLRRVAALREHFTVPIQRPAFDGVRHADILNMYRQDCRRLVDLCGREFPAWTSLSG